MPLVREQLHKLGLAPDTIDILMASWRKSTGKQYTSYLSRWVTYCKNKQLDVTHASINDGLDFLTLLYKQGVGYSAINTARSALSSVITPADKTTFGEHPLVSRFLKGTFELRPSLPRYSTIWDVGIVLKHLQSYPALKDLTLKQLTMNLTMLLALVTAQRTQTLSKLDTSCMQETTTGIIFTIRDTLKTTRPGKHLAPIEIRSFAPDSRLCPVTYIKHYITITHSRRSDSRLLISYTKPHKSVTNSTVARWIRSTLQDAGIDVSVFSAHSSRTASSSYSATAQLPLADILKAGGWSNARTFAEHYNKPISGNLGQTLLNHFDSGAQAD